MLLATSIVGNIYDIHASSYDITNLESLRITRTDMEKSRLRRMTEKGTDVGLCIESNESLHHGDVLECSDGSFIVVKQIPEKIIVIRPKCRSEVSSDLCVDPTTAELYVLLGHMIGNRHRPISVEFNGTIPVISFPIQDDSEITLFERLFADIADRIQISIHETVFIPHTGGDVHEH